MNMFSPVEIINNFSAAGQKKTRLSISSMLLLGILAGMIIALAGAATNTAVYSIDNVSIVRIICGLLFPFGLAMVILMGAELFTGNCLIVISVWEKKVRPQEMLKNWIFVYLGNFIGAVIVAFACANFGQFNYSNGGLAIFTVKLALTKATIPFANAVVMGFLCNFLVALGILLSFSAKDVCGKIAGAFLPVSYFVICGFEHCIANMYYIPAGIFAVSKYSEQIAAAGIDVSSLNWSNFIFNNLIPVTVGNILGAIFIAALVWVGHIKKKSSEVN